MNNLMKAGIESLSDIYTDLFSYEAMKLLQLGCRDVKCLSLLGGFWFTMTKLDSFNISRRYRIGTLKLEEWNKKYIV